MTSRRSMFRMVVPSTVSFDIAASTGNSCPFLRRPEIGTPSGAIGCVISGPAASRSMYSAVFGSEPFGDQHVQRGSHRLRLRIAEYPLGRFVEHRDPSIGVDRDDGVRGHREDPGRLRLRDAKRRLGVLAGRDVQLGPRHAGGLAPFVAGEHLAAIEDPDPLAGFGPDAHLGLVTGDLASEVSVQLLLDLRPVLRVDALDPCIDVAGDLVGAKTAHLGPACVEHHLDRTRRSSPRWPGPRRRAPARGAPGPREAHREPASAR